MNIYTDNQIQIAKDNYVGDTIIVGMKVEFHGITLCNILQLGFNLK